VVNHHGVAQDTAEYALERMVGALAATLPMVALIQVLASLRDYRQPGVAIAVWLAMFPLAFWLVPRIRAGGLTRREEVAAITIAIAAVAVIGWEHRTHYVSGRVDLAVLGTAWLLALVALTSPAWVWIPGALAVFTVHAVLLVYIEGASRLILTQLEAAGYVTATVLLVFSALRLTVAAHVSVSAHRALLASRSVAERAAVEAVLRDRQNRLAVLELEALPLLRAIADGTLDPAGEDVRERCARHAAALRYSLTDSPADRMSRAGGLLSGLEPVLKLAGARGLLVDRQVIGDLGDPSAEIVRAVAETVDDLLSALAPQQILLTVLASGSDVELYVTFSEPLRTTTTLDVTRSGRGLPESTRWHAAVASEETDAGYLQISWRKAVPG
jgi:hypothetical protein